MTARVPSTDRGPAAITAELRREIVAAIDAAGLSQRDLHAATGIAQSSISRVLSGAADPHVSTVAELLAAAGYELRVGRRDLTDLLGSATDPPLSAVVRLLGELGYQVRVEKIGDGP